MQPSLCLVMVPRKKLVSRDGEMDTLDGRSLVVGSQSNGSFTWHRIVEDELASMPILGNFLGSMAAEAAAMLWTLLLIVSDPQFQHRLIKIFLDADSTRQLVTHRRCLD